ncbi:MAG: M23 family metallopeptidase [Blastocatellia bacterium]|nr:M23 family metallopeptidase [Blastocatellia bacterium]
MKHHSYVLLILLAVGGLAFGQEKSIDGVWQGTLDAGGTKLRVVITITKASGGGYEGRLDCIDQGSTMPIDEIAITDDAVRMEVKAVGGSYKGTLNKDRTEMKGNWSQGGGSLPLTLKVEAPAATNAKPTGTRNTNPTTTERPFTVPLDVRALVAPTAFQAQGKTHLVYELHVTNMSSDDCALTRVDVLGDGDKGLASYEGSGLAALLARPGAPSLADKARIGGGLRAVIYLWVTLDPGVAVPTELRHRISVKVGDYPEELKVETPAVPIGRNPIEISPPLRGGEWLAANGPSNISNHRRSMIPIDGHAVIAQRFAIDWLQLREDGRSFTGDPKNNKNYRCYGAEALAVADAVVVEVKDGIPENIPGPTSRAVPITLETVGGNHVVLDLGDGHYAFYAHLQPGSLRVSLGDKVRRGQTLGLVGNSGNSTEPHLHFHITNANSPLGSEGLPYTLSAFEVQGKGFGWKPSGTQAATEKCAHEIPLQNDVVRFP